MGSHTPTANAEHDLARKVQQLERQLSDAYQREAATTEVLKVISRSALDAQCVLDTLVESATRMCDAYDAAILQVDGDVLRLAAHHGQIAFPGPIPVTRGTPSGRAFIERRTIHVADVQAEPDEYPESRERAFRSGWHTALSGPLVRGDEAIGVILIRRADVRPFGDREVELVETIDDQAVIAIENARLFEGEQARTREVTERTHALAEALHHQTATSEVLNIISRSPTDLQPVFDTIVKSAVRLCGALLGAFYKFDGELLHVVAHHNYTPEALNALQRVYPARPSRSLFTARSILERAVVHIPDVEAHDPDHKFQALSRAISVRSGLYVPMLREGSAIGVIAGEATSLRSSPRICAPLLRAWLQTRAPGRPANRQRAPAQRVARGAAAADRHRRCAKSHQPLGV